MGFGVSVRIPRGSGGSEYRLEVGQQAGGVSFDSTSPAPQAGPANQAGAGFAMSPIMLAGIAVVAILLLRR